MRVADRSIQGNIALALSHLCSADDFKSIFLDNRGKFINSLLILQLSHLLNPCALLLLQE